VGNTLLARVSEAAESVMRWYCTGSPAVGSCGSDGFGGDAWGGKGSGTVDGLDVALLGRAARILLVA
jgi:hypothetical protein